LNEDFSTSGFMDERTSYEYLYDAATEFIRRTGCATSTQDITTVADQANYTLNSDFIRMHLRDKNNRFYVKWYDASNYYFVNAIEKEDAIRADQTTSVSIPSGWYIEDVALSTTQDTGTTTSAGASSAGEATLTDSGGDWDSGVVNPGDTVHNTTDSSSGVVLSVTSATALVTALYGGTNNDWTTGDAYVINYQPRYQIRFAPPPSTASHTITVYYVQKPAPVYNDYGVYRIPHEFARAICSYAAFMYKYRDDEPNFGDKWFQHWELSIRQASKATRNTLLKRDFKVNLIKR
jgi:hypothetical protein